jgi:multiple sugar transport system ATP-binding protein
MDEPLSNLDAKLRVSARATLSKLHQRLEATFIYVTHDQVEAMTMGTRIAVMDKGLLQQIDTPQKLYDRPNNVFVGGFIGSPAMNFFAATLTASDGKMFVDTGAFRVRVPEDKVAFYKPHTGKEIIFGIRPEDIHDPQYAPPGIQGSSIDGRVDVTELMGNEVIVYVVSGNHQYMARLDPRTGFRVGNEVQVVMNMTNMHIFDRETEMAIRPK